MKKNILSLILFVILVVPSISLDAQVGETERLFVEPSYDRLERRFITARLINTSYDTHFFVDEGWWNTLGDNKKKEYELSFSNLGKEFRDHIFPKTRDVFGIMPLHRVTRDERQLTVVFHPMKNGAGGYFRSGDQYSMYSYTRSNQRNAVYVNTDYIETPLLSSYLAHEYMHLVTFNKKNNKQDVTEDVWLNELRSEMIITLLNYNNDYRNSNLRNRVLTFLRYPNSSLTEWKESVADYGVVNLFGQYLVDHYGVDVLVDSLNTATIGVESINEALQKNGYREDFRQVFVNFIKAIYFNDCFYGRHYCFKDVNLSGLTTYPSMIIMTDYDEDVSVSLQFESWSGGWYRIIGREGILNVSFDFEEDFTIFYVVCFADGEKDRCVVRNVDTTREKPSIVVEDFNTRYTTVVVMPILATQVDDLTSFNMQLTVLESIKESEDEKTFRLRLQSLTQRLERMIDILKEDFGIIQQRESIDRNLYYGMTNSLQVRTLQNFLKREGEDVYPEGLITGNFYDLTKTAVMRLQEKYWESILAPVGLSSGTGFVGESTRRFINNRIK